MSQVTALCRSESDKVRSSQDSVKSFVNHYTLFKYPKDTVCCTLHSMTFINCMFTCLMEHSDGLSLLFSTPPDSMHPNSRLRLSLTVRQQCCKTSRMASIYSACFRNTSDLVYKCTIIVSQSVFGFIILTATLKNFIFKMFGIQNLTGSIWNYSD